MDNVFLVAAACFALVFWAVGARFPALALALIFGSAPFANDLGGGLGGVNFSFSEISLVLTLPLLAAVFVRGEGQLKMWPFFWPCMFYCGACVASSFVQWRGSAAITSMFQMVLFMFVLIPVFSTLTKRPEDLRLALWSLLGVASIIALTVLATRSQYVLGLNKNNMGGSLGCSFLVAFELWFHYRDKATWHKWALIGFLVLISAGLLMTLSRGGWIGTVFGVILIGALRRQFALLGRVGLLLVPVLALAWQLLPEDSKSYATSFDSKRGNISQRYINQEIAMEHWRDNPLLGGGLGLRKQFDATQLVLFTLAETGIIGLATLIGVFAAFFAMIWQTHKRLAPNGMAFSLLSIGGALMISRLGQGMVDHYWARGPTMMAWAAAGMATGVFLYGPKNSYAERLKKARVLLALHLLEQRRRLRRPGLAGPGLSPSELARANEALAMVLAERGITPSTPLDALAPPRPIASRYPAPPRNSSVGNPSVRNSSVRNSSVGNSSVGNSSVRDRVSR